jgi:hypothetical protein
VNQFTRSVQSRGGPGGGVDVGGATTEREREIQQRRPAAAVVDRRLVLVF